MDIYVDGLERSGNNFISICIWTTLGIDIFPKFTHLVSVLEERDKNSLFVVPVRDVLPSIVSAKLYRDYQWDKDVPRQDKLLGRKHERTGDPKELIKRYEEYTQYLVDHDEFFIAPFHEFTKDHNKVIEVMIKPFPEYSIKQRFTTKEMMDACDKYYNKLNPAFNELSAPYLGNFPRESAKEKKEIETMFVSEYSKELEHIQSNIDELYKRYYREESR